MGRRFRVPVFNWTFLIHPVRKACEHFCVAGLAVDLISFLAGYDHVFILILTGKVAAFAGAYGVIVLHCEERRQMAHEQREINQIREVKA